MHYDFLHFITQVPSTHSYITVVKCVRYITTSRIAVYATSVWQQAKSCF